MKKIYFYLSSLAVITLFVLLNFQLLAQETPQFESEGTDFWLTFMPNYHNSALSGDLNNDSLYIFITSKVPTRGTIYYTEFVTQPIKREHHFEIKQPNEIYKFAVNYRYVALYGFNQSSVIAMPGIDGEVIRTKTFHVVTDNKATVYAMDYAEMTSEAFIVLPVTAIGKEYFVMAYNSDGEYDNRQKKLAISSTPSQFSVVATQDNTQIKIKPTVPTARYGMEEQTITLNKGEVYLVQAQITEKELYNDLTGTHIIADKAIAVFAGQQRTTLPMKGIEVTGTKGSRDCLIEQLIPVHSWGRNAFITPFATPRLGNDDLSFSDIFRIIAAKDDTYIIINNVAVDTLKAGEFYEGNIDKPALVTSNRPIMVALYRRSENFGGNSRYSGDPLMLIVPPVEQYKTDYNVINPQIKISFFDVFLEQYLTIVAPDTCTNLVYIDGQLVPEKEFIPIGNTGYSYAQLQTKSGGHNIACVEPISVLVYGYGQAVSYGYLGGMSFKDIEKEKIRLTIDTCFTKATFVYSETFNSGIKSYQILEKKNCDLVEESSTKWKLKLNINKYEITKPAYFKIKIIDIFDIETIFTDTMQVDMFVIADVPTDFNYDFGKCKISSQQSKKISIVNVGSKDLILDNSNMLMFNNTNFTIAKSAFPITVEPADTAIIEVNYVPTVANSKTNKQDYDTLLISNLCNYYRLTFLGEPIADTIDFTSRCEVKIRATADSLDLYYLLPIVAPNPTNENLGTVYKFSLDEEATVNIDIYNNLGRKIETIATERLKYGNYSIELPTEMYPTGNYFIELNTSKTKKTTQLIINK